MTIYVAMDDTDNINSRGTGKLSRDVAKALSRKYPIKAVTRHQLFSTQISHLLHIIAVL
ncbi:MAG: hypothetical protein ACRC1M_03190 [Methanobacteriaceae archaeon]